jgi:hypothetical protein
LGAIDAGTDFDFWRQRVWRNRFGLYGHGNLFKRELIAFYLNANECQ